MPCGATQDGWVMVERSNRMWSPGEGNGKPLHEQYENTKEHGQYEKTKVHEQYEKTKR